MIVTKEANAEPIPGYRLIEPLGSGGFGEVWKCEAPGGLFKAVKFVFGEQDSLSGDSDRAEEELRAVQHIKALRHPFLLSMDRVERIGGELVIVMELADQNLHELLTEYQKSGKQGIPRKELLGYLREAAEVLDLMNQQYQLQHLDVKPRNLFLVSNHVKVADFGLVNSLTAHRDQSVQLGAITPIYASPEVFLGRPSSFSDQYSLAIVYLELLTGTLPFDGKNGRQLLLQHTKMEPNLKALPEGERAAVSRALAKEPENRFPSCMDFIEALCSEPSSAHMPLLPVSSVKKVASPKPTEETVANLSKNTLKLRKDSPIPSDLLPGYRFGECLGRSPLVDKWLVERPDGKQRLLQILYGCLSGDRLKQAVTQLRSLQHPGLREVEIISADAGRIILLTGLVKETLRDRAQQCQARKQPGIMRGELLEYVGYAAETLDYLYEQHSIQHLCLNPRNLALLRDGRVQIIGYGLAQLLWLPGGQAVAHINGRYAAPELFQPKVGRACDQYSLALIYHEMLTGVFPFNGTTAVSGSARLKVKPLLDRLPEPDRDIIARALDPDPRKRWPSCSALVKALEGTDSEDAPLADNDSFIKRVSASRAAPASSIPVQAQENLNQIIADMIGAAGGEGLEADADAAPTLSKDGEVLHYRFLAGLPLGSARSKLESFCQEWYGQLIREDERGCGFTVNMPRNFWSHWIGRQPALEVQVILDRPNPLAATPIEVGVQIRALGCSKKRITQLLQEMGPSLLDNLRAHLLVNSEKRMQNRLLWPHPLKVQPIYLDGRKGNVIECQGKDLSTSGVGFFLPHELDTSEVLIELPSSVHPPSVSVPATLVRAKRCADGTYEVGALFRLPALRQNLSAKTAES